MITEAIDSVIEDIRKAGVKINPEFKKLWIDALRSGAYLQGHCTLYDPAQNNGAGGFCCLGVAGAVAGVPLYQMIGKSYLDHNEGAVEYKNIPRPLRGLTTTAMSFGDLNDNFYSFDNIANVIENEL